MIRALGSGSTGNAVLIGGEVLLDAGLPLKRLRAKLREAGVTRLTQLAFAAITHEHKDHAHAVDDLLSRSVDVVASAGTLTALGVNGHHRTTALAPDKATIIGKWTIVGIPVKHDAAEPMAFYVGQNGHRVLYVTDTESFEPGVSMKPTHVLIEANHRREEMDVRSEFDPRSERTSKNHMSVEAAMEALRLIDLSACQEVQLLHLSDEFSYEDEFIAEVAAEFGVPVRAAQVRGDADVA